MDVLGQFRLDGRVVVVTGGSKGLGKSMALGFAQAGAAVVVSSRSQEACNDACEELVGATDTSCLGLAADVTDPDCVDRLVDTVMDQFGRIDVWVNSAGINIRHPVEEFPVEEFERVVDTNLKGSWLCCRAVGPVLRAQRGGSVINIGSTLSAVGLAERTAYCSSKAGVLGLTRTLALEWAPDNVRCNALCPGPFLTEINRPLLDDPEKMEAVVGNTALHRWGELHEIQGAALFLASDASSFVTGSAMFVDGGWTAG